MTAFEHNPLTKYAHYISALLQVRWIYNYMEASIFAS